jgi:hypothetical protein
LRFWGRTEGKLTVAADTQKSASKQTISLDFCLFYLQIRQEWHGFEPRLHCGGTADVLSLGLPNAETRQMQKTGPKNEIEAVFCPCFRAKNLTP